MLANFSFESGIQLGNPTYITLNQQKQLSLLIINNNKILENIPEHQFTARNINLTNETLNGSKKINPKQLQTALKRKQNKKLWQNIKQELEKGFALQNQEDYDIITAWIIATHMHTKLESIPYILLNAPKRSGKSDTMELLSNMAFNGRVMVDLSPTLPRTIDGLKPTLFLDECEELHESRTKSERIGRTKSILNALLLF